MINIKTYGAQCASLSVLACVSATPNKRCLYNDPPSLVSTFSNPPRSLS